MMKENIFEKINWKRKKVRKKSEYLELKWWKNKQENMVWWNDITEQEVRS